MTIPSAEAVAAGTKDKIWVPPNTPLPTIQPVKGTNAKPAARAADTGKRWSPPADSSPPAGRAVAVLGSAGTRAMSTQTEAAESASPTSADTSVQAGALPVWIATAQGAKPMTRAIPLAPAKDGAASVQVEVADQGTARSAGVDGALVTLTDTGEGAVPGRVQVGVDTQSWARNAGANWASRARIVQLPGCALTTPGAPGCTTRTPVASHRDEASGRLVAEVEVPQASGAASKSLAASTFASPQAPAAPAVALAVEASSKGSTGDFTASPITPSAAWQAGANAGNFTYGYTVELPSAIAGAAPSVSLGYDSSSVDGKTASTNAQPSWIGEGWEWHPGSIVRGYKACKDTGVQNSGDQCWGGDLLQLSLTGHAGQLVKDDASCEWHLQGEDGTKVERLTGQNNGAWNGEAWRVTTLDGTQFYFGANHLPGGDGTDQAANSVSTVPIYWPGGQDPCLKDGSPATNSWSQMGWQWSLDYVVDPHQNLITYRYEQEQNYYVQGGGQNKGNGPRAQYQRASYPVWVGYGQRLPDQIAAKGKANPAAQVWFRTAERCFADAITNCDPSQRKANAKAWADTPVDQTCDATGDCSITSPTFWTTKRLSQIDTEVWDGSAYRPVDSYALKQSFPPSEDGTSPSLWLGSVQRTATNGRTKISVPPVSFKPRAIANRVAGQVVWPDGTAMSVEPFKRPRIEQITTETGGFINVVYQPAECSREAGGKMPSSEDGNTMACMPVKWYMPGQDKPDPANDWFNKIIVQSVTQQDAVTDQVPVVATYVYGGGAAWHRNDSGLADPKTRTWDQFRGYATVTTLTGNGSSVEAPRTKTVSTFLRGMDGDVLANGTSKRQVTVADVNGGSITDDNVLAGYIRDTSNYDAENGSVVSTVVSDPWIGPVTATRNQPGGMPPVTARAVNAAKVTNRDKLANGWRTSERSTQYDGTVYARPTTVYDNGDLSHPEQLLCTSFTYATGPNGALTQQASRTLVLKGTCNQSANKDNTVADTRSYFDNLPLGQTGGTSEQTATEVLERYDNSGQPVYRTTARARFDTYGRIVSTVDPTRTDATHPMGAETRTDYSPATGQLPTQVTHTNPLGWQSVSILDVGRGSPLKITDENGRVSEQDFDALGRSVAGWSPGNDRGKNPNTPNRKFSYSVNSTNAPSYVLTQALMGSTLSDPTPTYTSSYTIYDGLGRVRQTQASVPSGATGRMITEARFDSHGWQTKSSAAYYNDDTSPGAQLFLPNGGVQPDNKVPAQTVKTYDGMGRVTDSAFQSYGIEQWRSHTDILGADEVRTTPPAGGYASATIKDARGNTVALRQYKANTPTGPYDETTYGYTPAGKEAWRKDAAGNLWTYEYDLLGRLVKSTDPDSGTGTTAYDDSRNLATVTDSRGVSATTVSDLLGRTVAAYEGTATDPAKQVASWTYDTLALGKPTSSTRYVGGANGAAYTSEITGYDVGYRELGAKTTIPAAEGKLAGTYQTDNTYDEAGRLASTVMPAVAGMGRETLTFTTDTVGQLGSLSSAFGFNPSTTFVADVRYDVYGRPIRTTLGGPGAHVVATMVVDNATGRVTRSILDKENAPTANVDAVDYTYDPLGQVTSARDAQDGQVADLQCFNHDYLGRLTQAWTDTGSQTTAPQPSVPGVGSCANANGPSADGGKPSVGGPAPYWQQYEYDVIGNRTKVVQKDITGDATKDVTTTQGFGTGPNTPSTDPKTGGGTGGPHALLKSTQTGPAGTAVTSYTYDAAGNTTSITDTPGTRNLTWNAQGKLDQITGTGQSGATSYLYDLAGNQLIRRDPGKTTLNLGADQLTLDTASGAVTDVRSYGAPDGLSITRTVVNGQSTLAYQAADPHGTNGIQLDAYNLAQVRRPTDPFGNERGAQPGDGVWAGDKGFVGGTKEKVTGFTLLGAREYDPKTGRFISPDPVTDAGDPQQWNAYAYANNSPINKADANGLKVACDTPAECANNHSDTVAGTGRTVDAVFTYSPVIAATPTPPPTAAEQAAVKAKQNADEAVNQAKHKRDEIVHKVVDLVGELIGFNDARDCFTKGDVMACINTALNAVPWGKIFKAIKIGIQALKIYKEIGKAYDAIKAGERVAKEAEAAVVTARTAAAEARAAEAAAVKAAEEKAAKEVATDAAGTESKAVAKEAEESAGSSCSLVRNSFPTGTKVLMGDGSLKSIEDIHEGDVVLATDPQTGETHPEPVTATITTPDDKDFTDLTLTDDKAPRSPPADHQSKITSTHHHPYWSETRQQWVDAGELAPGERLRQPNGATLTVRAVRNYPYVVTTHNLTVNLLHTYYVLAGATPVLVHNCGGSADDRAGLDFTDNGRQQVYDANAAKNGGTYKCDYCGRTVERRASRGPDGKAVKGLPDDAQIDHEIPKAQGGCGAAHNGCVACRACNRDKSAKTVEEWDNELREFLED
ncbi:polymorphic toxin-type HINT domain-containing protein [Streptomyces sp. SP17BM10]|uniref:RHS repeat-associated core domain-containing protein n=1 Tax=Streptomyces sp. SP17BM10 TaxID=3002530 RepID=UPI002E7A15DA|nr:RHS repeat-associated core domain-containing protein [Streptomyces sp. SP17BM10]MEE1782759.1 polymorphic toxin-type HINT domain-containing protein [Streptomyces sp. SP17BM10]